MAFADTTSDYATKADTDLLRRDLDGVEQRLNAQVLRTERAIGSLYSRMSQRFDELKSRMDQRFDELKELILSVESKVDDHG